MGGGWEMRLGRASPEFASRVPHVMHGVVQVSHFSRAALELAGNRALTKAMDDEIPPHCYCALLSENAIEARAAAQLMENHFSLVLRLELLATIFTEAADVLAAMQFLLVASVRLLWMLFERDNFDPNSAAGRRWFKGQTYAPPDNKLVEDMHNYLRDLARKNRNYMCSRIARMCAAIASGRIEARRMVHKRVTKTQFKAQFNQARVTRRCKKLFQSENFRLPAYMSKIMGERTWESFNTDGMRGELTAWLWVQEWDRLRLPPVDLNAAWWSKVAIPQTVIGKIDGGPTYIVLKVSAWGVAAVIAKLVPSVAGCHYFAIDWERVRVLHVLDPDEWYGFTAASVCPAKLQSLAPELAHLGLLYGQTISAAPLLKLAFTQKTTLTVPELQRVLRRYELQTSGDRESLISRVCNHLCTLDTAEYKEGYIARAVRLDTLRPEAKNIDPDAEELWENWMDADDKKEHAGLGKALKEAKSATRRKLWQARVRTGMGSRKGGGRGKGKGKGRGPGAGTGKGKGKGVARNADPVPPTAPTPGAPRIPDPTIDIVRAPAAPPAPAALAAPPAAAARATPDLRYFVPWEDVHCTRCACRIGRRRLKPHVVSGPEWEVQLRLGTGSYATSGPGQTVRKVSVIGESPGFIVEWLMHRRLCCRV